MFRRILRKFASQLLQTVLRFCPPEAESWGQAMMAELAFIEGGWDCLRWALGSST